jgi:hypothetical protein
MRIHQAGNLRIAGARQVDGRKVTVSQDRMEQRLHPGTGFAGQEAAGLSDDGRWHWQFVPGRMQHSEQPKLIVQLRAPPGAHSAEARGAEPVKLFETSGGWICLCGLLGLDGGAGLVDPGLAG